MCLLGWEAWNFAKNDSITEVFVWTLRNFLQLFFYLIPPKNCIGINLGRSQLKKLSQKFRFNNQEFLSLCLVKLQAICFCYATVDSSVIKNEGICNDLKKYVKECQSTVCYLLVCLFLFTRKVVEKISPFSGNTSELLVESYC